MEERIHQRQELQDSAADITFAVPADDSSVSVLSSGDESTDDVDSEFEFPFVSRCSPALADELFADGRIRPLVYPVFGRRGAGGTGTEAGTVPAAAAPAAAGRKRGQLGRLFLEETRERNASSSTSSSAATDDGDGDGDGLEGAPPESYCVWAPGSSASLRPPRKSCSTGSMARWRRISDLVVGRSHSDGKEKFLFLPTTTAAATPPPPNRREGHKPNPSPKPKPKQSPASGGKKPSGTEINTVAAAHRVAYGAKAGAGAGAVGATPRRTFLPYREELVGFFANVHGIGRSHPHPY